MSNDYQRWFDPVSDEDQTWFDAVVIVEGRVYEGLEFATNRLRVLFIRAPKKPRQEWLEAKQHLWRRVEDVQASQQTHVESPAETTTSPISPDVRNYDKDTGSAASAEIPAGDRLPPQPPAQGTRPMTVTAPSGPGLEIEIAIGPRGYVGADRLASMWGISRKTLSRRIAAGKVPPKIKIGKKLYFEVSAIPEGLASGGSAPPTNNEAR